MLHSRFSTAFLVTLLLAACSDPLAGIATGTDSPATNPPSQPTAASSRPAPSLLVQAESTEDFGEIPLAVHLTATVREGTGQAPFTFIWDFGDATEFSSEASVTHVYRDPGSYRASVKVKDATGDMDQDYVDIWVLPPMTDEQLKDAMARVQAIQPSADQVRDDLSKRLAEAFESIPKPPADGSTGK